MGITSEPLSDVGIAAEDPPHVVNVTIGARPSLYMFEPCSATELAERFVFLNGFCDVSDIPVFKEPVQFKSMGAAPSEARELAATLQSALGPEFGQMFRSPIGGFLQGHVVVITGVQPSIRLHSRSSRRRSSSSSSSSRNDGAGADDGDDDRDAMKLALCEALGGIN